MSYRTEWCSSLVFRISTYDTLDRRGGTVRVLPVLPMCGGEGTQWVTVLNHSAAGSGLPYLTTGTRLETGTTVDKSYLTTRNLADGERGDSW